MRRGVMNPNTKFQQSILALMAIAENMYSRAVTIDRPTDKVFYTCSLISLKEFEAISTLLIK